jgi:two-component system response regulator VicR
VNGLYATIKVVNAKKRVLVVDDEPGILRIVRVNLSMAGYEVITETSGEQAIKLVQSESPDLVLLDVLLQPLDGLQILEKIRTFSQVPVLLFTARSFSADQALKLGANGIIAKPFRPGDLVKRIKDTLNSPSSDGS